MEGLSTLNGGYAQTLAFQIRMDRTHLSFFLYYITLQMS